LPACFNLDLKTLLSKRDSPQDHGPRFAYDGLDRVIHERARLSVLTSLMTHPRGLSFGDLKRLCALTDGNLNRHLQVLEESKLVTIKKGIDGNRPQTSCRITALGRKRYVEYLSVLEQVLLDAAKAVDAEPEPAGKRIRGPISA
jgi:DNA-binding HxlR family transcriptional regulator